MRGCCRRSAECGRAGRTGARGTGKLPPARFVEWAESYSGRPRMPGLQKKYRTESACTSIRRNRPSCCALREGSDASAGPRSPGLPMKKGPCGTMTHDYKWNWTATLFAALNTFDGTVISSLSGIVTQEWLKFLLVVDQITTPDKDIYLVVDNHAAHKHPKVERWLARRPRFQYSVHAHQQFMAQHGGAILSRPHSELLANGGLSRRRERIMAIRDNIDKYNERPKPFVWTKRSPNILEKVKAREASPLIVNRSCNAYD
jgi:hypothetical protein